MLKGLTLIGLFFLAIPLAADVRRQRGVLIYPDGNRATGRLVTAGVFASDRFGEIRYATSEAYFEPGPAMPDDMAPGGLKERVDAEVNPPASTNVRTPEPPSWHPWKFAISGFVDRTTDDGNRHREYYTAVRIERPSPANPLAFDARYEYRRGADRFDKRRATGTIDWRHKLPNSRWFTLYRPYFEYDGRTLGADEAAILGRSRLDYFFTQQQGGLGYNLLSTPNLESNLVLNWNLFHVWIFHIGDVGRSMPSMQLENTFSFGRGLELKQHGQLYWLYESASDAWLWENYLDLTQRLNDHLYFTLRHEYRKDHPLRNATPLDRLRLLFGINF